MKHLVTRALFIYLFANPATAAVLTVDNSTGSTADYDSLQTAIDSAGIGDTLTIAGSGINYGTIHIAKPLTLVGEGWCDADSVSRVEEVWLTSSNVRIFGLAVKYLLIDVPNTPGDSIEHILVERCSFGTFGQGPFVALEFIGLNGPDHAYVHDAIFRNNFFWRTPARAWGNDCLNSNFQFDGLRFENNIFERPGFLFRSGALGLETMTIDHNLFISDITLPTGMFYSECIFDPFSVYGAAISNNIFYAADPTGCNSCEYHNNLTYENGSNDVIPGPNNIIAMPPGFVGYLGGAFSLSNDFHLMNGSLCIGAASDSTDIGIYGGEHPWADCNFDFWDCPALQATFGDPCDDGNSDTVTEIDSTCACVITNTAFNDLSRRSSTITILPNPANDQVRVSWAIGHLRTPATLVVMNALGQVVDNRPALTGNNADLDIANLPLGAYFVKLQGEQWQVHGRFIKE